ncbi:hypothetical protein BD779DRAFT_1612106 [Infundibulicybe gibba]|nr:hypothetical protein BD779DRAFT_1612106 [Infundibulicybe gibba]
MPLSELDKRVQALKDAAAAEESVLDPPTYSEEELLMFYEDVLAISRAPPAETEAEESQVEELPQNEQDLLLIGAAHQRLLGPNPLTSESELEADDTPLLDVSPGGTWAPPTQDLAHSYHQLISRAHEIISRIESVPESTSPHTSQLPINVLSINECQALVRVCVRNTDSEAAVAVLDLMKRTGIPISSDAITWIMELYVNEGNSTAVEQILAQFSSETPNEHQRHLHVKSHIRATSPGELPTAALQVLHSYEAQAHPPPMKTYTSLITSLFSTPSSIARAQAWDLFSHMRYVAHPQPDTLLYTLMIRACASPISPSRSSEPERALDLWTEMTVDRRMAPTVGAYSAVILACARSGSKSYVNEAFRLAKEMLDSHRDARGESAFRPDRKTFCALLEGAKRIGDLARTRWILAEMVRASAGEQGSDVAVDEEAMVHVFHAYAAYRPPFTRATALLVPQPTPPGPVTEDTSVAAARSTDAEETAVNANSGSEFTHIPPQSRSEVINEARALFKRIIHDTRANLEDPDTVASSQFRHVALTTRLLNSYLSIHYKHSTLDKSRELFGSIFEEHGVLRNPRSYVEALEKCGNARRGHERETALSFAEAMWPEWESLEHTPAIGQPPPDARMVERAHVAYIRVLTLNGHLDRAVDHVKAFVAKYPPSSIRKSSPKPNLRSTRTALVGQRPLVRLTSSIEVPDDNVPPLLTFTDVEVLHTAW